MSIINQPKLINQLTHTILPGSNITILPGSNITILPGSNITILPGSNITSNWFNSKLSRVKP